MVLMILFGVSTVGARNTEALAKIIGILLVGGGVWLGIFTEGMVYSRGGSVAVFGYFLFMGIVTTVAKAGFWVALFGVALIAVGAYTVYRFNRCENCHKALFFVTPSTIGFTHCPNCGATIKGFREI